MIYNKYGKTDIELSALGFGGMRFENPQDIEESAATVLRAYELGINYFDSAPGYCDDKSEIIIGEAVKEMKKAGNPFYVSTKSMRKKAGGLRAQLEESLRRLNVDSIDFYNCWYVLTWEDWEARKAGGAVAEILKAKEEGLIKHAAFSTHLPGDEIRKVIEEGHFEGVTMGYSAINFPFREEGIAAAAENDLGVVIMNPLGGGLITGGSDAFDFIKVRPEQSLLEGALHFIMSDPRITLPIVGFRNQADVESAVATVDSFVPYTDQDVANLKDRITTGFGSQTKREERNDHDGSISERVPGKKEINIFHSLCTACRYCKDCPEGIPVWAFAETANHILLKGGEGVSGRLRNYWGVDAADLDRCTQCGLCESVCTQHLPIMDRFDMIREALKN